MAVLVGRLDDEAGEVDKAFGVSGGGFHVEHGVGADGQAQVAGRGVAVGEERPRGEYYPIGVERSRRRLEFDDGAPFDHRVDEGVDDGPPGHGAGRALGADVRPGVQVPGPRPLKDPVQAVRERQVGEGGP